jgi:pyridoxine kinase
MTVALPILSACGQECCVLPTAVLSTHTGGFGKPEIVHLTAAAEGMWQHWKSQGISFDAVLVGYLGSREAIDMTHRILDNLLAEDGIAIIDPAMGDHGKLYAGFDEEYVEAMKGLCARADILMPNITEAAYLAGMEYREILDEAYVNSLMAALPNSKVVLTGVGFADATTGAMVKDGGVLTHVVHRKVGGSCHGTGDIFAACFTGCLMQGKSMVEAAEIAGKFTARAIAETVENPVHWYGVKFENVLPELMQWLN